MRVTREILLNLAHENTAKFAAKDRGLVCVYLVGSLLRTDEPFLGGVTDIDLVFVHDRPVTSSREIVRINADVHLDIAHYHQDAFAPARKLRLDPWIGGALDMGAVSLHDPDHWFDLMRSTAVSQFWAPNNVAARSRSFLSASRRTWQELQDGVIPQGVKRTYAFLDSIRCAANAVASLNGMPLPVRRLFLEFPESALDAGLPNLTGELISLFTSDAVTDESWKHWLNGLDNSFESLKELKSIPPGIHPNRRNYFVKAISVLAEERPAAAVWILLYVWTSISAVLPKSGAAFKEWNSFCRQLGLDTRSMAQSLDTIDALLDQVEERIEKI